jgi:glycopeptide antibiotics resistance protein
MKYLKAAAVTVIGTLLGGCLGFVLARVLVERFDVVDGPPAAVLLVLSIIAVASVCGIVTLLFSLRWLRRLRRQSQ